MNFFLSRSFAVTWFSAHISIFPHHLYMNIYLNKMKYDNLIYLYDSIYRIERRLQISEKEKKTFYLYIEWVCASTIIQSNVLLWLSLLYCRDHAHVSGLYCTLLCYSFSMNRVWRDGKNLIIYAQCLYFIKEKHFSLTIIII